MKVEKSVLEVLSAARVEGAKVFLTGQLDRALYVKTDKILQAAGGKWSRKDKAHVFDGSAEERIDQIIVTGDVVVPKDEYNYFPSPKAVVSVLVDLADIGDGMLVLEPSAGRGAIARGVLSSADSVKVTMYELLAENCDALNAEFVPETVISPTDFLAVEPDPVYDRVVMNPPFMNQSDIKHVNHALKFLKPGGLLVAVMGAGVTFRENKLTVEFRKLVEDRGGFFQELPEKSFKESGTLVNTVVAVIPS